MMPRYSTTARLEAKAIKGADETLATIRVLGRTLTEYLIEAHGGEWRFVYNPDSEFVVIARQRDRATPQTREAI